MEKREDRYASLKNQTQNPVTRTKRRSKKAALAISAAVGVVGAFAASKTEAAVIDKANNLTNLNQTGSWQGGVVPGSGDVASFGPGSPSYATVGTLVLGGPLNWGGIQMTAAESIPVVIGSDGNSLTIGASGIDMTSAVHNLTLYATTTFAGGNQSWNVNGGTTLTIGGNDSDNATSINFQGTGTNIIYGTIGGSGGQYNQTQAGSIVVIGNSNALSGVTFNSTAGSIEFLNESGLLESNQTLNSANFGALSGSTNILLTNAQTPSAIALTVGAANNNTTYSGILSGGGSLTLAGTDSMTLLGQNTYTGTTTISGGGVLFVGNGGTNGSLGSPSAAITNNGTLFFDVAVNVTQAGIISGTGNLLTSLGTHTLDLTAANTFNGVTSMSSGDTIFLGNALALQNSVVNYNTGGLNFGSLTAATLGGLTQGAVAGILTIPNSPNGFTLSLGSVGAAGAVNTYLGTLTGGNSLSRLNITNAAGGGNVIAGTNSLTTAINIGGAATAGGNNGYLQFGNGGANGWFTGGGSAVGAITDNGTLDFNLNVPITVSNVIIGTDNANGGSNLTISSSANVTLTAANTFNGITVINGGGNSGLVLGNQFALESSLLYYNNQGGTLNFGSLTSANLGGFSGGETLNLANNSSAAVTLSFGTLNAIETYTGALSGAGSIIKLGTANEVFSGISSYTGGTTIAAGQLSMGTASAFGSPGGLTTSSSLATVGNGFVGGATLGTVASITTGHGFIISGPNDAVFVQPGTTFEVDGPVSTVDNTAGTNSFYIEGGTLVLTGTNAAAGLTDAIVITNTGILQLGNGTVGSIGSYGSIPVGTQISDAGTLVFDLPSSAGTFSVTNAFHGAGGFAQNGVGTTLILSGTNSVTGGTTVNGGTLQLGSSPVYNAGITGYYSPLGQTSSNSATASNGNLTVNAAGTLDMHGFNAIVGGLAGAGTVTNTAVGAVTLTVGNNNNSSTTFSGNILDAGAGSISLVFNPTASGTLNLTGTSSYTGTTTIQSGVVQATWFNNTQALGPGSYPSGMFAGNATNIGNLGNTSGLTIGAATLEILANTNGFSLGTTPVALGSTSSAFQIDTGSTSFEIDGVIQNANAAVGQLVKTGPGTLIITAPTNTFTGGIYIIRGNLQVGNGTTGTFSTLGSGIITDNGTITFDLPGNNTLTTAIVGTGGLTQSGSGILDVANVATYTGDTVISNGTLLIGNPLALAGSALDINTGGGVVNFGTQTTVVLGGLNGNASLTLANAVPAAITLVVGTNNRNSAFTGNISDAGAGSSLVKVGTASFTLSGTNSFSGGVSVNEGLLEFASGSALPSASPGSILVNPGGAVALDTGVSNATYLGLINAASTGALALSSVDAASTLNFQTSPLSTHPLMSIGAATGGLTYTGNYTPNGSTYLLGGGSTLTLPNTNQLTGTLGVSIQNGPVSITGLDNYTGATTINGTYANIVGLSPTLVTPYVNGVLNVTSVGLGGNVSSIGASSNAATNLVINGGVFNYVGVAAATDHLMTIGSAGATLTSSGSGPISFTNTGAIISASTAPESGALGTTTISGINTAGLAVGMSVSDLASDIPGGTTIAAVTLNSITLSQTATPDGSDTFTFGNQNRNLVLNGATLNNVFNGSLSDPSNGQLSVIEAAGLWTLGGSNTYSGNTVLNNGGELGFSTSSAFSTNSQLLFTGGILQASGSVTSLTGVTFNSNTFNGGFDVAIPSATFTVAAPLSGTGAMLKIGAGTLALTGSESYTGVTTVRDGTLNLNFAGSGALTSNILGASTSPVTLSGGTLMMTGSTSASTVETLKSVSLAAGPSTISVVDNGQSTSLSLGLLAPQTGATTQILLSSANATLSVASVLAASGGGSVGGISAIGNSVASNMLVTPAEAPYMIIGSNFASAATAAAPAQIVPTPSAAYTTFVNSTGAFGTGSLLEISTAGELRNSGGVTNLALRFDGPSAAMYRGDGTFYPVFNTATGLLGLGTTSTVDMTYISSSAGRTAGVGAFMMTPNVGANPVYLSNDSGGGLVAKEGFDQIQSITSAAGDEVIFWQLDTQAAMYDITGLFDRGGTAIVKDGPGTLFMLNTATQYAGNTYINGGTLGITDDRDLGGNDFLALSRSNPVIINGGTLLATGTMTLDDSSIGGTSDRPITLGADGGSLAASSGTNTTAVFTVDGVISGTGALNLTGAGVMKLTGNNTYTGGTNINSGFLQVDSTNGLATGVGNVNVNSGGTLDGIGTINTTVDLNTGGIVSPGDPGINNGVGTMTYGSMNFATGGILDLDELGGVASEDLIKVLGGLTIGSGSDVNAYVEGSQLALNSNGTYDLFQVTGPVVGASNLTLADQLTANVAFGTAAGPNGTTYVTMTLTNGSISGIWGTNPGGGWNVSSNWVGSTVPDGTGAFAIFSNNPTGITTNPGSVTLGGQNWTARALIFYDTNSYSIAQTTPGDGTSITLSEGVATALVADTLGSHTIAAPIQLASNANFQVLSPNSADHLLISGAISGAFGTTISGTGTTIFAGNNTYTNGTTINAQATLQIGAGGANGSAGTNFVSDGGTLAFDLSSHPTFANVISGNNGSVLVNSPTNGGVVLTGANSFGGSGTSGVVTIQSGLLSIGNATALGSGTPTVVINSPGILDVNGFQGVSIGTLSGNGTIDNVSASGNPSVVIGVDGLNETFSGNIADTTGTLTVYKEGSATTTLNGVSTYTGDTYIASGSLLAGVTNSIPAASNIFFESGGSNDLIMGDNVTISSPITIGSGIGSGGELIAYPGSLDADVASNISLVGGGGQDRQGIFGTGTLWFTGTTAFSSSQFLFLDAGALGYTGNGALLTPGTTLGVGRSTGNAVGLFFEGNSTVTANGVSTGEGVSMTNMSVEVDGAANVQFTGAYDMENSTNTASSGTITLNGGTLGAAYFYQTQSQLSPGNDEGGQNLPTGPVQGTYMNLNGGVLLQTAQVGTNAFLAQNLNNLDITLGSGGALFDSNGLVMSVSVPMETSFLADGGVQKLGLGSLVLSGINTTFGTTSNYVGPILVKGGLLQLVDTQAMGAVGLGPTYVPHMTVSAGGAAGMEGGSITTTGSNNASAFLTVLNQNGLASFGALALDPVDATDNISYTATYAGAVTAGGTFGMNNTVLENMSIGAQSGGVTYTGTITPASGQYLLGGGGTLTLPNANALTGGNKVTYENGGSVQVLNTNNYTGITTITGGYVMADPFFSTQPYQSTSLTVAALANGGSPSSLGQSSNAATSLIIQGGTLEFVGTSSGSTDRLFTIGSAGATLNASGTVAMNFTNTGTEAEGADTGQNGTTVGVGSATINNVSTAGLTLGTVVSDTGNLFPAGVSIVGLTPNSITLSQPATGSSNNDSLNFTNQLRALTLTGSSAPTIINTISSTLSDASTGALSLLKSGSNTWLVNGTNTYTGGTIVNAGDLQINSDHSLGNASGIVTLNAGTLETTVGGIVTARNFFLGTGSPTVTVDTGTYEIDGTIANSNVPTGATTVAGVLNVSGAGTLVLTGSNTYTGGTTIAGASTVELSSPNGSINGNTITDNGVLEFNRTDAALIVTPQIRGSGQVEQIGSGTTTLYGGNTYTGLTTVTAGTLIIGQAGSLPTNGNATNNSNLDINANTQAGTINGTGTTVVASQVLLSANSLTQGTLATNSGSNELLSVNNPGGGTIGSVTGAGSMSIGSGGAYNVTGTYTQTSLVNNGFLSLGGASTVGPITGTGTLTVNSGLSVSNFYQTTLNLNGNMDMTANSTGSVNQITGTGGLTLETGVNLQLVAASPYTVFSGSNTVSTVSSLTLNGSPGALGTLDITDNSLVVEYPGGVYNSAVQASIRADIISGRSGGTWTGTGITSTTAAADHANPGLSAYLGDSAIGYADNAVGNQIHNTSIPTDSVLVRFTLLGDSDLNGVVNLADFDDWLNGFSGSIPDSWFAGDYVYGGSVTLADFDDWLNSFSANFGSLATLDHAIDVSSGLSSSQKTELLDIVSSSVPEPASIGLLGIAAIGLLPRRRRRQK